MKTKPLVSVTMSTYNVEEFVRDSLECIVNQTLRDIEIICIDDGSTDRTKDILLEYAEKDRRVQVILKEHNEGLAVARNQSLSLAKGKYVAFVDGDDLMSETLFEKAYKLAESEQSDMVLWDYCSFVHESEIEASSAKASELINVNAEDKLALLRRPAFTWIKLIKTAVARDLAIHFPKGLTRQDIPVHWHLITSLNKIALLPERLCYYRQQGGATTHKKNEKLFHLAEVMDITQHYLQKSGHYTEFKDEFVKQQLNLLFGMYDSVKDELKEQAMSILNQRLGEDQWNYIRSNKPMRPQARMFYLANEGSWTEKLKFNFWKLSRSAYRMVKKK